MIDKYGLLGEKLGHSLSPSIHNMIFEELGFEAEYNLFEVNHKDLKNAIDNFKKFEFKGINVTIPYKVDVMEYMDQISEEASKIEAINTITFEGGCLKGYNTDYYGFGMLLKKNNIEVKGKIAVILGSGGASKSVYQYLEDNGAGQIIIVSRDPEKARDIFKGSKSVSYEELNFIEGGDIIINCTPVGMFPNIDVSPVEEAIIGRFSSAIDLIYNPKETLFLKYAEEKGVKALNGLYMLVGQAVKSQEIWNHIEISDEIAEKIFIKIDATMF